MADERQIPLFPWSSQARGFFTGRAHPDDRSDAELVRCYYSDDNFERLRRADELGDDLGVAATAIALAYVLNQPFPTFRCSDRAASPRPPRRWLPSGSS